MKLIRIIQLLVMRCVGLVSKSISLYKMSLLYMEKNDLIIANQQQQYHKNHSTTTALVDMTDQWLNAMDNGTFVGVLFLDFSAAFDLVDH